MAEQPIQSTTSPSEIYEQYMVPAIFSRWSAALLDSVSPQPGERVLDLACGTGVVARMAALMVQPGGQLSGVDSNGAQIATARTMDPSIDWREGDAGALSFAGGEFDLVVCQQGFHFFPDRVQAVKAIHRSLKPCRRVAVSVWSSSEASPGYLSIAHARAQTVGAAAAVVGGAGAWEPRVDGRGYGPSNRGQRHAVTGRVRRGGGRPSRAACK